ncbi:MAG: STAS domain-containing protein [Janthinobacterium lividum]
MSKPLTIHAGGQRGCLGLSLRGSCTTPADVAQLEQATQRLLASHPTRLWVDCQQLLEVSASGQRTLLRTESLARAAGVVCYWCGLSAHVLSQLATSGLQHLLQLRSAAEFEGPRYILPE